MSADFRVKQHLKMSPNAQIKNLVPENLSAIPPESEWKIGRIWFNTKIQCEFMISFLSFFPCRKSVEDISFFHLYLIKW